jgi:hypothetical protein
MGIRRGAASVVVVAMTALVLAACASGEAAVTLPPAGGAPDYQLGDGYPPEEGVEIVVRDRLSPAPEDVYAVCYVNAFQTQPDELGDWPDELILKDSDGLPVFDPDWPDEALLDTSTDDNREAIHEIVAPWIQECATTGFKAVEFDNLDTYTRSDGALTLEDNLELAEDLVEVAHDAGLAAAQKNAAEDAELLRDEAEFDFAIAEQCAEFDECELYQEVYGDLVIAIEYDTATFNAACLDERMQESSVLRDRELRTPDEDGYVFELCDPAD